MYLYYVQRLPSFLTSTFDGEAGKVSVRVKPKAGERRKEDVSTDSSSSDDDQDSPPWYVEPLPSTGAEKQAYIDAVTLP